MVVVVVAERVEAAVVKDGVTAGAAVEEGMEEVEAALVVAGAAMTWCCSLCW